MGNILRFKKRPELHDLEGLMVNGGRFIQGTGFIVKSSLVMDVPNVFRFKTKLEVAESSDGDWDLILTQFLTSGPEYWEMGSAFSRIGFRDPELKEHLTALCEELISRGLAYWADEVTA